MRAKLSYQRTIVRFLRFVQIVFLAGFKKKIRGNSIQKHKHKLGKFFVIKQATEILSSDALSLCIMKS